MDINIGNKIKFWRKLRGMTGVELSEKLNITQAQISRYENNLNTPPLEILKKMCDIFNISLSEFFAEESDLPYLSSLIELKNSAKQLSELELHKLNEFLLSILERKITIPVISHLDKIDIDLFIQDLTYNSSMVIDSFPLPKWRIHMLETMFGKEFNIYDVYWIPSFKLETEDDKITYFLMFDSNNTEISFRDNISLYCDIHEIEPTLQFLLIIPVNREATVDTKNIIGKINKLVVVYDDNSYPRAVKLGSINKDDGNQITKVFLKTPNSETLSIDEFKEKLYGYAVEALPEENDALIKKLASIQDGYLQTVLDGLLDGLVDLRPVYPITVAESEAEEMTIKRIQNALRQIGEFDKFARIDEKTWLNLFKFLNEFTERAEPNE